MADACTRSRLAHSSHPPSAPAARRSSCCSATGDSSAVWLAEPRSATLACPLARPPQQRDEQSSSSHSHACQSHTLHPSECCSCCRCSLLAARCSCERKVAAGLAGKSAFSFLLAPPMQGVSRSRRLRRQRTTGARAGIYFTYMVVYVLSGRIRDQRRLTAGAVWRDLVVLRAGARAAAAAVHACCSVYGVYGGVSNWLEATVAAAGAARVSWNSKSMHGQCAAADPVAAAAAADLAMGDRRWTMHTHVSTESGVYNCTRCVHVSFRTIKNSRHDLSFNFLCPLRPRHISFKACWYRCRTNSLMPMRNLLWNPAMESVIMSDVFSCLNFRDTVRAQRSPDHTAGYAGYALDRLGGSCGSCSRELLVQSLGRERKFDSECFWKTANLCLQGFCCCTNNLHWRNP